MITLYSGTPGSGKSLHLARFVHDELALRKNTVIANFPINMPLVTKKGKRKTGQFTYLSNDKITVDYLIEHAQKHHKVGKEGQTLLVIDEAGIMFNARDYGSFDRKSWIQFFMTHRHYGYNVILVSQSDRMIDRQIRAFIEYDVKHRKMNNFRFIGLLLTMFRVPLFAAVTYWYGIRERVGAEIFRYRKRDGKLFDTMMLFGGESHGERVGIEDSKAKKKNRKNKPEVPAPITPPGGDGDTGSAGGTPSRPEADPSNETPNCLGGKDVYVVTFSKTEIQWIYSLVTKSRDENVEKANEPEQEFTALHKLQADNLSEVEQKLKMILGGKVRRIMVE